VDLSFSNALEENFEKNGYSGFHGFAWIEATVTNAMGVLLKTFLLISERVSYKFSNYVVTASERLANTLDQYFGERREVFVIENAVPFLRKFLVNK